MPDRIVKLLDALGDPGVLKWGLPPALSGPPMVLAVEVAAHDDRIAGLGIEWALVVAVVMAAITVGAIVWRAGSTAGHGSAGAAERDRRIARVEEDVLRVHQRLDGMTETMHGQHRRVRDSLTYLGEAVAALLALMPGVTSEQRQRLESRRPKEDS
jgi:hypothetical protein